jgi:hypothetical protein
MSEMRESMLIEFFYLEIDTRRVGSVTVNLINIQPSLAEELSRVSDRDHTTQDSEGIGMVDNT